VKDTVCQPFICPRTIDVANRAHIFPAAARRLAFGVIEPESEGTEHTYARIVRRAPAQAYDKLSVAPVKGVEYDLSDAKGACVQGISFQWFNEGQPDGLHDLYNGNPKSGYDAVGRVNPLAERAAYASGNFFSV
jgi:hypothetical protein